MTAQEFRAIAASIFNMGQNYWRYADSESLLQNRRADQVYDAYKKLVDETMTQLVKDRQ